MGWTKLGILYKAVRVSDELLSHASNPLPVYLKDDTYRVFFSGRDNQNRSSIGHVDIDVSKVLVKNVCKNAVVSFGESSTFYSHGISIGNSCFIDDKNYIYFMGWNIPQGKHWRGDIGRLELMDKSEMIIDPELPFMGVDDYDPISLSYPFVVFHEGIYKMWYGSTITWEAKNGEMIHVIKYATSTDGLIWVKQGLAIPYELGVAQAFSRPTVIIDEKGYHMWYSYRSGEGTSYRIGYAHSSNGEDWIRIHEKAGIDVSRVGWDSEMICYPFVFRHKNNLYMLYNGNDFGRNGFGLAKWVK